MQKSVLSFSLLFVRSFNFCCLAHWSKLPLVYLHSLLLLISYQCLFRLIYLVFFYTCLKLFTSFTSGICASFLCQPFRIISTVLLRASFHFHRYKANLSLDLPCPSRISSKHLHIWFLFFFRVIYWFHTLPGLLKSLSLSTSSNAFRKSTNAHITFSYSWTLYWDLSQSTYLIHKWSFWHRHRWNFLGLFSCYFHYPANKYLLVHFTYVIH